MRGLKFISILFIFFLHVHLYAQAKLYNTSYTVPQQIEGYTLVWSEEFDDTILDENVWSYEHGFVRNEEDQWYQSNNVSCYNGMLHIVGKKERFRNPSYNASSSDWRYNREYVDYTSASINTSQSKSWLYGRFEVRAKLPIYPGTWPAIWTLGVEKEWPSCGEIDIMEYYGNSIHANVAWGTDRRWVAKWDSSNKPMSHFLSKDSDWANQFHVWRMDWTPDYIKLYLDDELLNTTYLSSTINADGSNPFHQPHYLLLNLALGGKNGGDPGSIAYPITYLVDYVRIYQKDDSSIGTDILQENSIRQEGNIIYFDANDAEKLSVNISQLTGEILMNKNLYCIDTIDLSSLQNGIYLVQAQKRHETISKKIIINHK